MVKPNYDRHIIEILNRRPLRASSDEELVLELEELNAQFEKFSKQRRPSAYSDSEETEVEDEPPKASKPVQRRRISEQTEPSQSPQKGPASYFDYRILGFIVGILILLKAPFPLFSSLQNSVVPSSPDLSLVNDRIGTVEEQILAINDITKALSDQADSIESKQQSFIAIINDKVDTISSELASLDNQELFSGELQKLHREFEFYKSKIGNLELILGDSNNLEASIASVQEKLTQISRISNDITSFKEDVLKSLIDELPSHVPVYIKGKKIHYLPEFQNFLQAFVERYNSKTPATSNLAEHYSKLELMVKTHVSNDLKNALASYISRDELRSLLNEKLADTSEEFAAKLNTVLDQIDLSGNTTKIDVKHATNKVMLDNLIDVVSKGSVKMNFADYKNGARILGFLTTTGRDTYKSKSFARRIFLGWYDYLNSNGLRSPQNLKYDANNILVDSGTYWECESNRCSVGVRLSSPIILTDLIFKNPSLPNSGVHSPTRASIYIKPSKRSQVAALEEYLNRIKPGFLRAGKVNKYLTKFFKVQEVDLLTRPIGHVRLPVSLINMRILVKDIYIEIASPDGSTGLYNLKAYGITEFNSLVYSEEFESILDGLQEEPTKFGNYYSFDNGKALGDDDYI